MQELAASQESTDALCKNSLWKRGRKAPKHCSSEPVMHLLTPYAMHTCPPTCSACWQRLPQLCHAPQQLHQLRGAEATQRRQAGAVQPTQQVAQQQASARAPDSDAQAAAVAPAGPAIGGSSDATAAADADGPSVHNLWVGPHKGTGSNDCGGPCNAGQVVGGELGGFGAGDLRCGTCS